MAEPIDPRGRLDARLDGPEREGLTGTAPTSLYTPSAGDERLSLPPDARPAADQPAWRHDFPIDWPADHYVERRDFLQFMVLVSGAFTLGQFGIAGQAWLRSREPALPAVRVASLAALPVDGAAVFAYPGERDHCLLVRVSETEVVAYGQKCTHLSCAVTPRVADGTIHCPCHEGVFDLRSGTVLAGPPPRPLTRVRLEVRGDDVYATGLEPRTI
jgi:nitrite reductase/ring-hydroxylating ferredoxin subunit